MKTSKNTRFGLLIALLAISILSMIAYWIGILNLQAQFDAADPMADSGISLGFAAWVTGGGIAIGLLVIATLIVGVWTWRGSKSTMANKPCVATGDNVSS
jgi:uncharacterized membrane protein YidH (DUF202 family)